MERAGVLLLHVQGGQVREGAAREPHHGGRVLEGHGARARRSPWRWRSRQGAAARRRLQAGGGSGAAPHLAGRPEAAPRQQQAQRASNQRFQARAKPANKDFKQGPSWQTSRLVIIRPFFLNTVIAIHDSCLVKPKIQFSEEDREMRNSIYDIKFGN